MPNISKRITQKVKEVKTSRRPLGSKVVKPKGRSTKSPVHLRRLTVSSQAVARDSASNGLKSIPFLRLTGVWLEEAGFSVDSKVDVIVDDHLLIIKPVVISNA